MWAIAVPLIVFISVVGPIWVVFHYITVWKRMRANQSAANPGQQARNEQAAASLRQRAEKLEARIETLERLLDGEVPEWRNRV